MTIGRYRREFGPISEREWARCKRKKLRMETEAQAIEQAARASRELNTVLSHYACEYCNGFHIGHEKGSK